jgi:hypothetical protein
MLSLGCGTMFHPERRGNRGGKIDVGVAVMDSLWIFAFIIPAVVAWVVDLNTGAIYISDGRAEGGIKVVETGMSNPDTATIEAVILEHTGKRVHVSEAQRRKLASRDAIPAAVQTY